MKFKDPPKVMSALSQRSPCIIFARSLLCLLFSLDTTHKQGEVMVYLYFQNPGEQCALLHDLIYDQPVG